MNLTKEYYDKDFCPPNTYEIPDDLTLNDLFKVNINKSKLIGFLDTDHIMILERYFQLLGLFSLLWDMGGAIVYKYKKQCITDIISTKAKFIAAHSASKNTSYL